MTLPDLPTVFYIFAVIGVFLTGVAKGGLGGSLAMLGTPFLALTISPLKAAAILLPILLVMDAISVYSHYRNIDWSIIKSMLPGAVVGITIGWSTVSFVSDDMIRIIVGAIAIAFAFYQVVRELLSKLPKKQNRYMALFWGTFTGFTSFIAHAGGPPYQTYTVPLKMDKLLFVGTSVVFFAMMNSIKLIPYFALGQFNSENLTVSVALTPIAIAGVFTGVWAVKRISQTAFYNLTYIVLFVVGAKLVWDGVVGI